MKKMRVVVYGTSSKMYRYLLPMLLTYNVVAFVDSNKSRTGKSLLGIPVVHHTDIGKLIFDSVIICSSYVDEITENLNALGISDYVICDEVKELNNLVRERDALECDIRMSQLSWIPQNLRLKQVHIGKTQLVENRLALLKQLPASGIVAEIGVDSGHFSEQILAINRPETLYLIDNWGSVRYGDDKFEKVSRRFLQEIRSGQVELLRKLSEKAVSHFPDKYFDWVYIDTTHSYQQTKLELILYSKKIKKGGVIAGHDYLMGNWESGFRYGVMEAVHEFCKDHGYQIAYLTMDLSEGQSFALQKIQNDKS